MSTPSNTIPARNLSEREQVRRKLQQRSAEHTYTDNITAGAEFATRRSLWRRMVDGAKGLVGRTWLARNRRNASKVTIAVAFALYSVGVSFAAQAAAIAIVTSPYLVSLAPALLGVPMVNIVALALYAVLVIPVMVFVMRQMRRV